MRFGFHILGEHESGKRTVRLAGNPLALVLLLAVLLWLALFVRSAVKFTWDHYSPYEGTVVEIKRDWTDHLTSESAIRSARLGSLRKGWKSPGNIPKNTAEKRKR